MVPHDTRGRCRSGSTAEKVCNGHMYMCAKFHACFQKCTNILLSHWTNVIRAEKAKNSLKEAGETGWVGLSGGFTPCRHPRPSSGREHTFV